MPNHQDVGTPRRAIPLRRSAMAAILAAGLACLAGPALAVTVAFSTLVQWNSGPGANGHWYAVTDTPDSWTASNLAATQAGGYLASVLSAEENAFLVDTFTDGVIFPETSIYWIGFNDAANEGTFEWSSGEPAGYTNWAAGEPNDFQGGIAAGVGEDYAAFNWLRGLNLSGVKGNWNDVTNLGCGLDCRTPFPTPAIVEFNSNPLAAPEPAGLGLLALGLGALGLYRRRRAA